MSVPVLDATSVSKTYGATAALRDVSLQVERGQVVALLGQNGCGKSTFVKLVSAIERPDPGASISVAGVPVTSPSSAHAAGVRVVHQKLGLFETASVAENLAVGAALARGPLTPISWRVVNDSARQILERFGIEVDPRTPVRALRASQRAMLAIARALADREEEAGLLILDEPTASLPAAEREHLLAAVRRFRDAGHGIVYVTHYLDEVRAIADTVAVLRNGVLMAHQAVDQVTNAELVELVTGHAPSSMEGPSPTMARTNAEPRLTIEAAAGGVVRHVDLSVHPGEIVGIAGLADCGASELLRMVFGAAKRTGAVQVDGRVLPASDVPAAVRSGVMYVPPDRAEQAAFGPLEMRENLSASALSSYYERLGWRSKREHADAAELIRDFDIRPARDGVVFNALSGGNQQKVVMARWLRGKPRTILLDHPTQGVDVGARETIYAHLSRAAEEGAAVVVVTSDFAELAQLCHRVVVMVRGRIGAELRSHHLTERGITDAVYQAAAA